MAEITFQTVRLDRGRHRGPDEGVCVMELASMLAGEPFSDEPEAVCPVIAAFLRDLNDGLEDDHRDGLYASAALVVGSTGSARTRRGRARLLRHWALDRSGSRTKRALTRLAYAGYPGTLAAAVALRLPAHERRQAVDRLLADLLAVGGTSPTTLPDVVPSEPEAERRPA